MVRARRGERKRRGERTRRGERERQRLRARQYLRGRPQLRMLSACMDRVGRMHGPRRTHALIESQLRMFSACMDRVGREAASSLIIRSTVVAFQIPRTAASRSCVRHMTGRRGAYVSCVYRCVYCDSFTDEEDWGRVV